MMGAVSIQRRPLPIIAVVVVVLAVALGAIAWVVGRGGDAVEPELFDATQPGDLVSVEPWSEVHAGTAEIWKIRYLTTDRSGRSREASALVSVPPDVAAGAPLIGYAHGTTGIARACAPSDRGTPQVTDGGAVASALAQGWVVVAPDYSGLGSEGPHGYLVGVEAAHDLLDALRAARRMRQVEVGSSNVVWGQSQGGHAALWAGVEAPRYAPDLELAAVAAVAPPADLGAVMAANAGTPGISRLHAYLLDSWRRAYPESGLSEQLDDDRRGLLETVGQTCGDQPPTAAEQELTMPVLPPAGPDTVFGELLAKNSVRGLIAAPVLVVQGDADLVVPVATQRDWVARQCASGQRLQFEVHPGADHLAIAALSDPRVVAWVRERLGGARAPSDCP